VHANTGDEPTEVTLQAPRAGAAQIVWQTPGTHWQPATGQLELPARGTVVMRWPA
jgi:hypothetical protein